MLGILTKLQLDKLVQHILDAGRRGNVVSVGVLLLVGFIILPIPTFLLDFLLVLNIVLAVIVLLRGLSLSDSVKLFSFPGILLISTLFRLALNVSSTRLILTHGSEQGLGAAGEVIGSFGAFMVQGDFAVGVVIFLLIAVVNFMVIAKGSARVAEVAARFVLDAMPGKQLAIDADLRSGLIDQEIASSRRAQLNQESQFYGAMDGAMKFVQGDAIASLIIVFINSVGGIGLALSRGQGLSDAVEVFGVLAIGDGLVNIVPSLLMSLSAGVMVTNVGGRRHRGSGGEIFIQLLADPEVLLLAGFALLVAAVLPGFPLRPFAAVGVMLLGTAYYLKNNFSSTTIQDPVISPLAETYGADRNARIAWDSVPNDNHAVLPSSTRLFPGIEPCILELDSAQLVPSLGIQGEFLVQELTSGFELLAQEVYFKRGVRLPALRVSTNPLLAPGEYRVLVRESEVRRGVCGPQRVYIGLNAAALKGLGITPLASAVNPVDRRAGNWVASDATGLKAVKALGANVYSIPEFLLTEAKAACLDAIEELLGVNEVKQLVSSLRAESPALVEEVIDKGILSHSELTELLRRLVREGVCIRDLKLLLEGISECSAYSDNREDRIDYLAEVHSFLRIMLSRSILREALGADDTLRVFMLASEVEEEFRAALPHWSSRKNKPNVAPEIESTLRENARKLFNPVLERGNLPVVLLCSGDVRHIAHEFFVRNFSASEWLRTIAFQELGEQHKPESVGVIKY